MDFVFLSFAWSFIPPSRRSVFRSVFPAHSKWRVFLFIERCPWHLRLNPPAPWTLQVLFQQCAHMHQHSNSFAHPWRRCSLLPSWFFRQCFLGFFHTSFHASKYASEEWLSAFNLQLSLSTFFLSFLFSTFDFSGRGIDYTQNFHESHMYLLVLCPLHADLHISTQDWSVRANVWDKHRRQQTGTEALIFTRRGETHQGKSDTFQTIRTQTRMQQREWEGWCYNFCFYLRFYAFLYHFEIFVMLSAI